MPKLSWRGTPATGGFRRIMSVVFPVPGVYIVNARFVSDDPGIDTAGRIQNVRGGVAWVEWLGWR